MTLARSLWPVCTTAFPRDEAGDKKPSQETSQGTPWAATAPATSPQGQAVLRGDHQLLWGQNPWVHAASSTKYLGSDLCGPLSTKRASFGRSNSHRHSVPSAPLMPCQRRPESPLTEKVSVAMKLQLKIYLPLHPGSLVPQAAEAGAFLRTNSHFSLGPPLGRSSSLGSGHGSREVSTALSLGKPVQPPGLCPRESWEHLL